MKDSAGIVTPSPLSERERFRLRFGPYEPPRTAPGRLIKCLRFGRVQVGKISHARLPWPVRAKSRALILCGDLVRAIHREAAQAVAYHWGVTTSTVQKWRGLLGVGRSTEGTRALSDLYSPHRVRRAKEMAFFPRRRPRRGSTHVRSFLYPSPVHSVLGRSRGIVNPNARAWTADEDRLIGTLPDRALAQKLKRTTGAVRARRRMLGLPPVVSAKPWRPEQLALLGKVSDGKASRLTGHPISSVRAKRISLGRTEPGAKRPSRRQSPVAFAIEAKPKVYGLRWRPQEDQLLGTMSDEALASKLGRAVQAVSGRRHRLGISLAKPQVKSWNDEEVRLLGKLTDKEVSELTGRSRMGVALMRRKLRIRVVRAKVELWTAEEDKFLGSASDVFVARKLRRSVLGVSKRRMRLGILASDVCRWTPDEDKLLGSISDAKLAKQFGRTLVAVAARRRKLNLAPCPTDQVAPAAWTAAEERLLGTNSDEVIAATVGRSKGAVQSRRALLGIQLQVRQCPQWTAAEDRLLGTQPDAELARRLGRTLVAVRTRRSIKGIRTKWHPSVRLWTPAEIRLLGTKSDREVAKQIGRTAEGVKIKRLKSGIPRAVRRR